MTQSSTNWQPTASQTFPDNQPSSTLLIIPGYRNSSDLHWQSIWERERDDCRRAELGQWDDPQPSRWVSELDRAIRSVPGKVVLVAHSLGCIAAALWAATSRPVPHIVGALLVAPCDPEDHAALPVLRRFAPVPQIQLPFPATVIASSNDPYATSARSYAMARTWGADFINVGAKGHINAESGLGTWSEGQILVQELARRAQILQ